MFYFYFNPITLTLKVRTLEQELEDTKLDLV